MRRMSEYLVALASCVLAIVAFDKPAYGFPADSPRAGAAHDAPLLGGLAGLGFWWLWRRFYRRGGNED